MSTGVSDARQVTTHTLEVTQQLEAPTWGDLIELRKSPANQAHVIACDMPQVAPMSCNPAHRAGRNRRQANERRKPPTSRAQEAWESAPGRKWHPITNGQHFPHKL
jgi:hypothetical protein